MLFKILLFSYILISSVLSNEYINSSINSNQNVTIETEIPPTDTNFTNEFDYINVYTSRNSNIIIPRVPRYVLKNGSIADDNKVEVKNKISENLTNAWIATPLKKTYSGNFVRTYKEKSSNLTRRGILNRKEKTDVSDYLRNRSMSHSHYLLNKRILRDLNIPETNFEMYGDSYEKHLRDLSTKNNNETIKGNVFQTNVREFPGYQNGTVASKMDQKKMTTPYVNTSFSEYVSKYNMFTTPKPFSNKVMTLYTVPLEESKLAAKIKKKYPNGGNSDPSFDVYGNHLSNNDLDKSSDDIRSENILEVMSDDEDFSDVESEHNSEDTAENSNDMSQIENLNRDFEENEYDSKDDNDYEAEDVDSMSRSSITTPKIQNLDKNDFAFYGDAVVELKFTENPLKVIPQTSKPPIPISSKLYPSEKNTESPGYTQMSEVFPEDLPVNRTIDTNYLVKSKVLRDIKSYNSKRGYMNQDNSSDLHGFLNQEMHHNIQKHNLKKIDFSRSEGNQRDIYVNSFNDKSKQRNVGDSYEQALTRNKLLVQKDYTDLKDLEPDIEPRNEYQKNIREYNLKKKSSKEKLENEYVKEEREDSKNINKETSQKNTNLKVTTHQSILKEDGNYGYKEDGSKEDSSKRRMDKDENIGVPDEPENKIFPLHFQTVNAELNYPYVVMYVFEPNQVYCDAVTISAYWILSSATCLIHSYDDQSKQGYVAFCSSTWWNSDFTAVVLEAMIQKKYFALSEKKNGANVGIARVAKDMSLCNTWYPASIIKKPSRADKEGSAATAVGWGLYRIRTLDKDFDDAKVPNTPLRSVDTKVTPGLCPGTTRPEEKKNKYVKKYLRSIYYCMQVNPAVDDAVVPEVGGVLIMKKYVVGIASEITQFDGKRYTLYTAVWNTSDWLHHPSKRDIKPDPLSDPEALLNPLDPDDEHNVHDDLQSLVTPSSSGKEKISGEKGAHNLTLQKNSGSVLNVGIVEVIFGICSYLLL